MTPSDIDSSKMVTALVRGFEILRAFEAGESQLGNAELSAKTGIPRPTLTRLLYTLSALGYLDYNAKTEKYKLGVGILGLGYRYLASTSIRAVARPYMQELANVSGCTIALGVEDRLEVTFLECCHGRGPLVLRVDAGMQFPLATTAIGRACFVGAPAFQQEQIRKRLQQSRRYDMSEFEQAIQRAQASFSSYGFCISQGEWTSEINSVAVPFQPEGATDLMAFSCSGPASRLTLPVLQETLGPRLREMVSRIMQRIERPADVSASELP